jgi:glycosyltransferase involved in cell wall biosynthesis
MRICLATSSFLPMIGGAEVVVHNLACALTELGHDVVVLAPRYSRSMRPHLKYRLQTTLPGMLRLFAASELVAEAYFRALVLLLRRSRFDVVNVHFALPLGHAFVRHRAALGVPVVLTLHGTDIQTMPSIGYGLRTDPRHAARISRTIEAADGVVAISGSVYQAVVELRASQRGIFKIPNGVDVKRLQTRVQPNAFRDVHGLRPDDRVILAVGRNHPKKGFRFLVQAMAIVRQHEPRVRCVIVGRGAESLAPEVESLGLQEHVILPGEASGQGDGVEFPSRSVVAAYQGSDVFVSPSLIESFSLVTLEAMAAGLPVVVTDAPGNRDLVSDGHDGLLCRPEDPKDLARKLLTVLEDNALRQRLSVNAVTSARPYDWKEIARQYAETFASLARRSESERVQ